MFVENICPAKPKKTKNSFAGQITKQSFDCYVLGWNLKMKVRALVSFSDVRGSYAQGEEFELPDAVDWLRAGLVEPVRQVEMETAVTKRGREKAVTRKS